ncbi:heterogeneous nuclear ribonucleoprotein U-like protein 1 [Peromyscus leucopus]|uniref:heterogeneous nuclear ribonucleoprotein U-like protein 1 n=1 Tax=Peromyscus leucopus TaxID=10041 RepID=UPI001884A17C|nr:heterogeneous nuclear ribonucleoprotein U-like protein 1 [Peromyscus leucopus]
MEPKLVPRRRGGGEGSGPPPGVPRSCAPSSPERGGGGGSSRFWQPGFHRPFRGGHGVQLTAALVWCAPGTGEKSSGSAAFSSCGARSRPGKARSPQCAKHRVRPSPDVAAQLPAQPGSSARSDCTGVPAPVRRHPLPRAPQRYPQERSERCAPARREGSLSHSHPALVPPPPPPPTDACWAL